MKSAPLVPLETCLFCRDRVLFIDEFCPACHLSKYGRGTDPAFKPRHNAMPQVPALETSSRNRTASRPQTMGSQRIPWLGGSLVVLIVLMMIAGSLPTLRDRMLSEWKAPTVAEVDSLGKRISARFTERWQQKRAPDDSMEVKVVRTEIDTFPLDWWANLPADQKVEKRSYNVVYHLECIGWTRDGSRRTSETRKYDLAFDWSSTGPMLSKKDTYYTIWKREQYPNHMKEYWDSGHYAVDPSDDWGMHHAIKEAIGVAE
jgi:hypothetical protein